VLFTCYKSRNRTGVPGKKGKGGPPTLRLFRHGAKKEKKGALSIPDRRWREKGGATTSCRTASTTSPTPSYIERKTLRLEGGGITSLFRGGEFFFYCRKTHSAWTRAGVLLPSKKKGKKNNIKLLLREWVTGKKKEKKGFLENLHPLTRTT